jgi:hypothetical protein
MDQTLVFRPRALVKSSEVSIPELLMLASSQVLAPARPFLNTELALTNLGKDIAKAELFSNGGRRSFGRVRHNL